MAITPSRVVRVGGRELSRRPTAILTVSDCHSTSQSQEPQRATSRHPSQPKSLFFSPQRIQAMSALRRLAQTNNAINSPRMSDASTQASPSTPVKKNGILPTTPRTRISYPISLFTSPSRSASVPFDWEAARTRRPPPYASPLGRRARAQRNGATSPSRVAKRVVRKKGIIEKLVLESSTHPISILMIVIGLLLCHLR